MTNFIANITSTCNVCDQQHVESSTFADETAMRFYTYGVVSYLKDLGDNLDLVIIDFSRDGGETFTDETEIAMPGVGFKKMPDLSEKPVKELFDDLENIVTKFFDSL